MRQTVRSFSRSAADTTVRTREIPTERDIPQSTKKNEQFDLERFSIPEGEGLDEKLKELALTDLSDSEKNQESENGRSEDSTRGSGGPPGRSEDSTRGPGGPPGGPKDSIKGPGSPPENPEVIRGKSDRQILADARVIAKEIAQYTSQVVRDTLEKQQEVEALLQGNQGVNIKSALESIAPDSTKSVEPQSPSSFERISNQITEVMSTWGILMNEKYNQAKTYNEILYKLRLPEFRLPAWLESYATGQAVDVIEKNRKERYNKARKVFLQSKTPLSKQQKSDLKNLIQTEVDNMEANKKLIVRFFKQDNPFAREYLKSNSLLRRTLDPILDRLVINYDTREVYEEDPPQDIVDQVKTDFSRAINEYASRHEKEFNLTPDQITMFMNFALRHRRENIEAIKKALASSEKRGINLKRKVFSQDENLTQTPEELKLRNKKQLQELVQRLSNIVGSFIGREELTEVDEKSTSLFNSYARVLSLYQDPNFAPSLHALGYKWVKEHPEGSKKNYLLVETTREGDGEKLLTVFDTKTGAGMNAVKLLGDYIKEVGVPDLREALDELERIGDVTTEQTEERRNKLYDEQSEQNKKDESAEGEKVVEHEKTVEPEKTVKPEEEANSLNKTITFARNLLENSGSSIFKKMREALNQWPPSITNNTEEKRKVLDKRLKIFDVYTEGLRELKKIYSEIRKSLGGSSTKAFLGGLVKFAGESGAPLTSVGPQALVDFLDILENGFQALINPGEVSYESYGKILEGIENAFSRSNIVFRASGDFEGNVLDENAYQQYREKIVDFYKGKGLNFTEEEILNYNNPEDVEMATGENNSNDNPKQEPVDESNREIKRNSRIDVNRTNRLIALHKVQRAVNNLLSKKL